MYLSRWSGVVCLCARCRLLGGADGCSTVYLSNPGVARCPRKSWLVMALFFTYMLITVIMLVNLLIAIFRFNWLLQHMYTDNNKLSCRRGTARRGLTTTAAILRAAATVMLRAEFKHIKAVCSEKYKYKCKAENIKTKKKLRIVGQIFVSTIILI